MNVTLDEKGTLRATAWGFYNSITRLQICPELLAIDFYDLLNKYILYKFYGNGGLSGRR